jgi:hypothetical protein
MVYKTIEQLQRMAQQASDPACDPATRKLIVSKLSEAYQWARSDGQEPDYLSTVTHILEDLGELPQQPTR